MFMKHNAPTDVNQALLYGNGGPMWGRVFVGCQGGCERERRIEVIVNILKKWGRGRVGGGGGVRAVDVSGEVKFL